MTRVNAIQGRRAQRQGAAAELHARQFLRYLGIVGVREVKTGMRKIAGKWIHAGSVEGDIRGMIPVSGRAVLAEAKSPPDVLWWSILRPHQVRALDEHAEMGGLSLLCWRHARGLCVLRWRPEGFNGPGTSLSVAAAEAQAITRPLFWLPKTVQT